MGWPKHVPPGWAGDAYPTVWRRVYYQQRRKGEPPARAADQADEATSFAFTQFAAGKAPHEATTDYGYFLNWLTKVACRHAVDHYRRQVRDPRQSLDKNKPPGPGEDPVRLLLDAEDQEKAQALFAPLSERERQILLWYYRDGLTDQEIGERLYPDPRRSRAAKGQAARKERIEILNRLRQLALDAGLTSDVVLLLLRLLLEDDRPV